MKKFIFALLLSLLIFEDSVADVEWNASITNEYVWRGMSQGDGTAVSGGIDISSDSGLWAGAWVTNVDFDDNTTYELDLYVGYTIGALSIGYVYYAFPNNTDEGYDSSEINISADIGAFTLGANILADADWDMDFGDEIYYSIDTAFGLSEKLDLSLHIGFYDYDIDDDETDYGMSFDFMSGFSFGVIDSTRDNSDPFVVISYSING
jgi:uncharacterized protein (TIGR02001 family)